jgi:hypothetical protein
MSKAIPKSWSALLDPVCMLDLFLSLRRSLHFGLGFQVKGFCFSRGSFVHRWEHFLLCVFCLPVLLYYMIAAWLICFFTLVIFFLLSSSVQDLGFRMCLADWGLGFPFLTICLQMYDDFASEV